MSEKFLIVNTQTIAPKTKFQTKTTKTYISQVLHGFSFVVFIFNAKVQVLAGLLEGSKGLDTFIGLTNRCHFGFHHS